MEKDNFKRFWIVSVNGWLCDAAYSGKFLKSKHLSPSFRSFKYIKEWEDIKYFTERKEISNRQLIEDSLTLNTNILEWWNTKTDEGKKELCNKHFPEYSNVPLNDGFIISSIYLKENQK